MDDYRASLWSTHNPDPSSHPYHPVSSSSYPNGNYTSTQQTYSYAPHAPGQMNYPPPLPPGPPPGVPSQMYHFGQPSNSPYPMESTQFSFQSASQLPSYPTRDPSPRRYRDSYDRYEGRYRQGGRDRQDRDRDRQDRPRFERRVRMAADRPLLHTRRDRTPDQLDGMADENTDIPKFRNLENMSDSDSEIMVESESENDASDKEKLQQTEEIKAAPRWSNPEPYTSLPPPEASRKRKDVVKLIRKARVAASKNDEHLKQLAQNDDFISFGIEKKEKLQEYSREAPTNTRNDLVDLDGQTRRTTVENTNGRGGIKPDGKAFDVVSNNIASRLTGLKRKRSIDDTHDEAVPPVLPKRQRTGKKTQPTGEILDEWAAKDLSNCTPWASEHQWTENAGFRLHKEICDFYDFVKPHYFEETMRLDLLGRIRKTIKAIHPDCEVHAFGSFAAGLYLPDADLDLVIISRDFVSTGKSNISSSKTLFKLSAHLISDGLAARDSVEVITKAKVPLIKFKDLKTSIRVDLSFENLTGPKAVLTFRNWKASYPAMPVIITVIKQFLMMRNLNEVVSGGLGGFSVTCLVTALLQNMPRVQSGELVPEQHLGEVLLEFLDLYGNQFDLYATAIDFNPPQFIDKVGTSCSMC